MENLKLEIYDDVVAVIDKIRGLVASELDIEIPEGSVLFENSLNLKLIKKSAEKLGKTISFNTPDEYGLVMLDLTDGAGGEARTSSVGEDFVPMEISIDEALGDPSPDSSGKKTRRRSGEKAGGFSLPGIDLGFIKNFRLPSFKFKAPKLIFVVILVLLLGGGGFGIYKALWIVPKAEIKVVVSSQPLVKSVELEVNSAKSTDAAARVLEGKVFSSSVSKSETGKTTGEKIVGEKAEGRIKIINRTTEDKDFDEGDEVYAKDDDDLVYVLTDDVTVPGGITEVPVNPTDPVIITPGSAEVDVEAKDIGKDYNIDEGEDMEFDDYDSSKYVAEVVEDIDGGSSDIVKIVAQADMDALSTSLSEKVKSEGPAALKTSVESGWIMIKGSESNGDLVEEFSHKVGDETEEIELAQTMSFYGLAYKEKELGDLLDKLIGEFVPENFELIPGEKEVNVEILGNTDATFLSSNQADLQVTIKSFVIPEIDDQKLKEELVGTKLEEAQKILGGIRNQVTYEINMNPKIPLLSKLPSNPENIELIIKKE